MTAGKLICGLHWILIAAERFAIKDDMPPLASVRDEKRADVCTKPEEVLHSNSNLTRNPGIGALRWPGLAVPGAIAAGDGVTLLMFRSQRKWQAFIRQTVAECI